MNFLKKLFGLTDNNSNIVMEAINTARQSESKDKIVPKTINHNFSQLLKEIEGIGNTDFPFLCNHYSPNSRVPCKDFTTWIAQMIKQNDWEAIELLARQFVIANPGIALSMELNNEGITSKFVNPSTDWAARNIRDISKKNYKQYVQAEDSIILELIAIFCVFSKKGGGLEFTIFDEVNLLLNAFCVYDFNINKVNLPLLVEKANKFKKGMGKGTTWDDLERFKESEFEKTITQISNNRVAKILQNFPVTTRASFFDLLGSYKVANNKYFTLQNPTIYSTRKYGVIENEVTDFLMKSGLFKPTSEINALEKNISKSEMKEYFEQKGYELKKSWTAAKIIEFLNSTEKGKTDLTNLLYQNKIVEINEIYKDDIENLIKHKEQLSRFAKLLCFI